jgi:peptide/nickel transport system permease protein
MAVVAFFVFSLLYLTPGDPAAVIAGDVATAEDIARIRQSLGLDQPFLVRFGNWVWALFHGDFGTSIFSNLPVSKLISQRVEPTLSLTIIRCCFSFSIKGACLVSRILFLFIMVLTSSTSIIGICS